MDCSDFYNKYGSPDKWICLQNDLEQRSEESDGLDINTSKNQKHQNLHYNCKNGMRNHTQICIDLEQRLKSQDNITGNKRQYLIEENFNIFEHNSYHDHEIDVGCIMTMADGHKRAYTFEVKSSNNGKCKAMWQLSADKELMKQAFGITDVIQFYVCGSYKNGYDIHHIK